MDPIPQRKTITLNQLNGNRLIIDSNFESGNIGEAKIDPYADNTILIVTEPDTTLCGDEKCSRSWFNFKITGVKDGQSITFIIERMGILRSIVGLY